MKNICYCSTTESTTHCFLLAGKQFSALFVSFFVPRMISGAQSRMGCCGQAIPSAKHFFAHVQTHSKPTRDTPEERHDGLPN